MKNSWTKTFRRLAAGAVVAGSMAFSSAMCHAFIAFDNADDPVYADGWDAGDNGGFGFTPWNFDSAYIYAGTPYAYAPGIQAIDDGLQNGTQFSNPFNDIGRAWAMAVPEEGFPRAGRGFAPLQPGQTLTVIVDNPTEREFFKGYFIRLNGGTGGVDGNICNQGQGCTLGATPVPQLRLQTFEYFTNGRWQIADDGFTDTPLFDTDTADGGMRVDVTLTTPSTYELVMTPLANPANAFMHSGTLMNPGVPVDWIEFDLFFTENLTDTGTPPTRATDFYISSMSIVPEPGTGVLLLVGAGGALLGMARARRRQEE